MQVTLKEISSSLGRIHLFKSLDNDQLLSLAKQLEVYEFKAGEYIFQENASAEKFYLVYQGEVTIGIENLQQTKKLWILNTDDYFGEDVLSEVHLRCTFALASADCVLLAIPRNALFYFLEENPTLITSFRLIESTYKKLIKQEPSWIKPEEATRFLSRASSAYIILKSVMPVAWMVVALILGIWFYFQTDISVLILFPLAALAIIFGGAWLIWNLVDWSNDYYLITKRRVVYLEKVLLLYESRQETPLSAILSITKQTRLVGRILGYSDVAIRTYTGVLVIKHLSSADAVIQLLSEQWERIKKQISNEDREEMETLLREKIKPEESDQTKADQIPEFSGQTTIKSGLIISILAALFGMRSENETVITYRTHWFILLQKIFLPSISLIVLFVIFSFFPSLSQAGTNVNPLVLILSTLTILALLWWVYQFVDWRNDCYLITKDQLVDINRKPLGLEDRRSAPIKNIQTVEYKRKGIWGILLNFGTVFIRVGDVELTFDYVHNPSQVQKEIFDRYNILMNLEKKNQLDAERRRMAAWMEAYHHIIMEEDANR